MPWKSDNEKETLGRKLTNPMEKVLCPTCGCEITHEVRYPHEIAECKRCGSFVAYRGL